MVAHKNQVSLLLVLWKSKTNNVTDYISIHAHFKCNYHRSLSFLQTDCAGVYQNPLYFTLFTVGLIFAL